MLYKATHTTRYTYEGFVSHCLSEVKLTPRTLPNQQVHEWSIEVTPSPAQIDSRKDYFGNTTNSFAVVESHDEFIVTAHSLVEVTPAQPLPVLNPIEASEFLWESPYVPYLSALEHYGPTGIPPAELAQQLMSQIHRDFLYKPKSTSIETPLDEVLKSRKGVCQDFAHVMIGALRAKGIAARYVSGYLRGDAALQGSQASHAWVSVYIPGTGWKDYDPTNDVIPNTSHISLAWGRDYSDVTPVKGITIGGGKHTLDVDVRVIPV